MQTKSNPYDWINPIRDKKYFAGREKELDEIVQEILKLKEENMISSTIALIGERRVGKTSLLLRIKESCTDNSMIPIMLNVDTRLSENIWEFWKEIYYKLLSELSKKGIKLESKKSIPFGFQPTSNESNQNIGTISIEDLKFITIYQEIPSLGYLPNLSPQILLNDLLHFNTILKKVHCKGLILILDEAQVMTNATEIKQNLRNIIQQFPELGVIFSGEKSVLKMFTDVSEPFYGQAKIVKVDNFAEPNEIIQCILLPLDENEMKLINPMTINYISKLSRGKPNQIRLICCNIYKRYLNQLQDDLNITMDVLDDILDDLTNTFSDSDLKDLVTSIQKLDSSNLEILHNLTRYPNWKLDDIIQLDESFRGELKSASAIRRRTKILEEKKSEFIGLGLMESNEDLYHVKGGEFIALYLRFYYETQKYGKLSKKLILGEGPATLFGELTAKLVRSLAFNLGQELEIQRFVFHRYYRDFGYIIENVKNRFNFLQKLLQGEIPKANVDSNILTECFSVCELIGKSGDYFLLCLSIRNRDNPRELIQVELYFDFDEKFRFDLKSLFNLLNKQAEEARVLIEGYDGFKVNLPDLSTFLDKVGVPFEKLVCNLPTVGKWWFSSIKHIVDFNNDIRKKEEETIVDTEDEKKEGDCKWITKYKQGELDEAEQIIVEKITDTRERIELAKLYNDLGYIMGFRKQKHELARKQLQTALDLHYKEICLTLLNIGYLDIIDTEYEKANQKFEIVLLLSLSPREIDVGYLRLHIPEYKFGFINKLEQNPANTIETAYINLAYSYLKLGKANEAYNILKEGLEIFPDSVYIKHSLARHYLYNRKFPFAKAIYKELGANLALVEDEHIKSEIKYFDKVIKRTKRR